MSNLMKINNLDKMDKFHEKYKVDRKGNKKFDCLHIY